MKSNGQQSQKKTNNKNFGIEEDNETTELLKREQLENTPFTIVEFDKKYFASMGMYRLTELHEDKTQLIQKMQNITWNNLIQVITILITEEAKLKELTQ